MKILVVGCMGMLGTDMMAELKNDHMLIGVDMKEALPEGTPYGKLDITDLSQVERCVKKLRPDVIINCAAYTDVDGCEMNVELAYKVNAIGPRHLALACNIFGSALVHVSTDYVFDGKKGGAYREDDPVNPLSVYGKSKCEGENYIRGLLDKHYIVRTQWLYGVHGKNFVRTMLNLARDRKELKVVNDQFGSPTYTKDLCRAIGELIRDKVYGTYHVTNSGIASWYEFTQEIFHQVAEDVVVKPCTTEEFPRPAVRPAYSPLENWVWGLNGHEKLRSYQEALGDFLNELND